MENEVKKSAGKVWLIPTIVAAVLLIGLVVFMVIMGKGTSALADGTVTLSEAVSPLQDGTAQLSDGVDQYTGGVDTMNEAMPTLQDGVTQYTEGVDQLNGYMKKLNDAVPTLATGVATLYDNGTKLADGLVGMLDTLDANTAKFAADATTAAGVQYDLAKDADGKTGPACLAAQGKVATAVTNSGVAAVTYTAAMDNAGLQGAQAFSADTTVQALVGAGQLTAEQLGLIQQMCSVGGKVIVMDAGTGLFTISKESIVAAATDGFYGMAAKSAGITVEQAKQVPAIKSAVETQIQTFDGAGLFDKLLGYTKPYVDGVNASQYAKGYQAAVAAVTPAVGNLASFYGSHGAAQALATVKSSMINGGITKESMATLKKGLKDLNDGVNGKAGLAASVKQLYKDGSNKLAENSDALRDGVKQLADGAKQLSENSQALRDGASQLKDAAPALIDGIGQLVDGAKKVNGFTPIH